MSLKLLPYHALIIDQVEDVFSNLKLSILWEVFLEVPAPATVKHSNK